MAGSSLSREQYKVAIPQLSKKLNEILDNNVKIEKKVVNITQTVESGDADYQYFKELVTGYFTAIVGDFDYLTAHNAYIEHLVTEVIELGVLSADSAIITNLQTDLATAEQLIATKADISDLNVATADIESLKAKDAELDTLVAGKASISDLNTANAEITDLKTNKADVSSLTAINADISDLKTNKADVTALNAATADIDNLKTGKADVSSLTAINARIDGKVDINFANIDFANIDIAKLGELFAESGIIQNVVTEDGYVTGRLAGVTITGDLIEGNTIKADKLVILGSDGLYYKLNVNGESVEAKQTDYNSINGTHIQAKSITASKIAVTDLVAFGATIGGLVIADGGIHSVGKTSVDSSAQGIYFDSKGQFNTGDDHNFIASWYDEDEKKWKVAIQADQITFGSGESVTKVITGAAKAVEDMQSRMDSGEFKGEDAVVLRIDSSRGTVFKNNMIETVLSVCIYSGASRITNIRDLHAKFGSTAYLQWYWQKIDESDYGLIPSTDSKLSDSGFTMKLSPDNIDEKVTFRCELITGE